VKQLESLFANKESGIQQLAVGSWLRKIKEELGATGGADALRRHHECVSRDCARQEEHWRRL
jgi:hypothetical protein